MKFELNFKEEHEVEKFRQAAQLLTGKQDIQLKYLLTPTPFGCSVVVIYEHENKDGSKTSFEKDVTDYDYW